MEYAAPTATTTREQIVNVARDLVQTRSYLGFSFQDVADKVGIRKASLYHHFATKEALGIEVVRQSTQAFTDWTAARQLAPEAALDAFFRMYRNGLRAGSAVCPAGAFAPGWDAVNEALRQAVRDLRGTQVLWLTGILGALAAGHSKASPVGDVAAYVFAVGQGALLAARMTGRVEDFDAAIAQLRRSLVG